MVAALHTSSTRQRYLLIKMEAYINRPMHTRRKHGQFALLRKDRRDEKAYPGLDLGESRWLRRWPGSPKSSKKNQPRARSDSFICREAWPVRTYEGPDISCSPPPRALGRWPCRELGRCWPRAARFCFALASQHLLGGIQGIFDQDAQPVAPLLQRLRELRQDVFPVRLGVQGGYIPDIPIAGFRAFKYVSSMAVVKVTFAYSARADYHHPRSSARPQGRSRPVAPSPAPLASGQRA